MKLPWHAAGPRRPGPALVVSIILHAFLVVVILEALAVPAQLRSWLRGAESRADRPERISYVVVTPPPPSGPATLGRAGGDGRRGNAERSTLIQAPTVVPTDLPVPSTTNVPTSTEDVGTGPLIGGGGPRRGVQPSFGDPRVWVSPGPLVGEPKTATERLDSALVTNLEAYRDSVAAVRGPPSRRSGDWTIERGGQTWGIDPPACNATDLGRNPDRANEVECSPRQYIRLGPIKIPAAVLAALPLNNIQGNPVLLEREKRLSMMRAEILEQVQRGMNEQEFRDAVKSIRERKERERAREEAKKSREADTPPPERSPVTR